VKILRGIGVAVVLVLYVAIFLWPTLTGHGTTRLFWFGVVGFSVPIVAAIVLGQRAKHNSMMHVRHLRERHGP
jgi:hypothetical protein